MLFLNLIAGYLVNELIDVRRILQPIALEEEMIKATATFTSSVERLKVTFLPNHIFHHIIPFLWREKERRCVRSCQLVSVNYKIRLISCRQE